MVHTNYIKQHLFFSVLFLGDLCLDFYDHPKTMEFGCSPQNYQIVLIILTITSLTINVALDYPQVLLENVFKEIIFWEKVVAVFSLPDNRALKYL